MTSGYIAVCGDIAFTKFCRTLFSLNLTPFTDFDVRLLPVFVNHHKDQPLELKGVQQVVVTVK